MKISSVIKKMSSYLPACVKVLCLLTLLLVSLACDLQRQSSIQSLVDAQQRLEQFVILPPANWQTASIKRLQRLCNDSEVMALLVDWALSHPQSFTVLLAHLDEQSFRQSFVQQVVGQGKSFVFMERYSELKTVDIVALLNAITELEQQDHRTKVTAHQFSLTDSLERVASFVGEYGGVRWEGAAFLLAQSECQLGLATAGHNVIDADGTMRAPLAELSIRLRGEQLTLVEVLPIQSPTQPEQDWTLLIADKLYCGKDYTESSVQAVSTSALPEAGLAVSLYCYHQSDQDVMPSLYQEQCRIYPTNAGVLDYYAGRVTAQLGIHSCISEPGSSGCPILFQNELNTYFLGTQIERDATTGAGIARLLSDEFAQALVTLRERFAQDDLAYRLTPLGRISAQGY